MATDTNPHHRFLVEAREHLSGLTAAIVTMERGEADPAGHVAQILRLAHSLKGGAGFSGLTTIERLAHAMETALENIRDGHVAVGADVIDALLFALDRIGAMVDDVEHSQSADISAPLERLRPIISIPANSMTAPRKVESREMKPSPNPVSRMLAGSAAMVSEFPVSRRVQDAWQQHASFLYGVKLDWFECERGFQLVPLEISRRLEQAGTVLDARMELSGPALPDGLPTPPLWYWTIISSALGPAAFAQQLDIPCAGIVRLESVANSPRSEKTGPTPGGARPATAGGSLRIPVALIDRMMNLAGELVLVRNQATHAGESSNNLQRQLLRRLDALTNDMQDAALRMRMQPVGTLFDRFPRLVRDLARQLGKQIELEISGTDVELDKSVLEVLTDPLTHLVRNCCDHGIEMPQQRTAAGKKAGGLIRLSARQERGQIIIQIRDDGRGLDREAIKRKALQQGIKHREELDRLSERQLYDLILLSGFSTAKEITDVSGRGVGMDVVRTNLEQIGGAVEIDSVQGQGATFTLRLPLTLAILPCLLLASSGRRFAIPLRDVEEVVLLRPGDKERRIECTNDDEVLRLRGSLLSVTRLAEVLARREPFTNATRAEILTRYHERPAGAESSYVVVIKYGSQRFGVVVDAVLGSEEIVVKPLHPLLRPLGVYGGATILGDGSVALILNSEGLARHSGIAYRAQRSDTSQLPKTSAADTATLLLFRYGAAELLAVPLGDVRRILAIRANQIERLGDREMVAIDGIPTNVLRLDRFLRVSSPEPNDSLFMILPRHGETPAGFLASQIIDTPTLALQLNERSYRADGVLGSGLVGGQIAIFLDLSRLVEMWRLESAPERALARAASFKRILVIEDTEFFRRLVASYLTSEGHHVVVAGDGAQGLATLESGAFDLVVSDIEMPVMDGMELARRVREDARFARLPMLALTSLSGDADRSNAQQAGFDAFEVKLNRNSLVETVRSLLAGGRSAAIVAGATTHE
jgi:two-component system chemotaxis sensor kinase CheA